MILIYSQRDSFCKAFSEIGTMRSLIPATVNVLALTATATKETGDVVKDRLCMTNTKVIGISPDRVNIKYSVLQNQSVHDLCSTLAANLMEFR